MLSYLMTLLAQAASQIPPSSPFGYWAQQITLAFYSTVAPQFSIAKRGGSTQVGVQANSNIELNLEGASRGITYNGVSWILTPGKTYRLSASGWFNNYSNPAGSLTIKWVDDNDNPLTTVIDSPSGVFLPATSTDQQSPGGTVPDMIFTVPANATNAERSVKLRCTASTGNADLPSGAMTAVVQEIPG